MNGRGKDWFTWLVIAAAVMASVLLVNPAQSRAMSMIELTAAIEENGMLRDQSLRLPSAPLPLPKVAASRPVP
jgi:hypothetical protein